MAELLLTFHCSASDTGAIGEALRGGFGVPVHVRDEDVLGLDFSDASTAERVTARLDRRTIQLVIPAERLDEAIGAIARLKRSGPVRWHAISITARGRIE